MAAQVIGWLRWSVRKRLLLIERGASANHFPWRKVEVNFHCFLKAELGSGDVKGKICVMKIQLNTDNTIESHKPLVAHMETVVSDAMFRFSDVISRVEVHLSVVNDHRQTGGEHRCLMEARIEHHQPIAVSEQTASLHQAIHGAAEKLKKAVGSTLGRIDDSARHTTDTLVTEAEPDIQIPEDGEREIGAA